MVHVFTLNAYHPFNAVARVTAPLCFVVSQGVSSSSPGHPMLPAS